MGYPDMSLGRASPWLPLSCRGCDDLLEALADLEHRQWATWASYMLANLSPHNTERWQRQIRTPYANLTEIEKDSDREWAREALTVLSRSPLPALTILPGSDDDVGALRCAMHEWGFDAQSDIWIEEMAELIWAILKARRNKVAWTHAVFEEIADVLICLQQMEVELRRLPASDGTPLWATVLSIRDAKMARLQGYLKEVGRQNAEAVHEAEAIAAAVRRSTAQSSAWGISDLRAGDRPL